MSLIDWLYTSPNFWIAEQSLQLAVLSGKIKSRFAVALTDAFAIATGHLHNGKAVFRKREREILNKLEQLTKAYELVFLEDY